jgi:hypothetical protein
MSLLQVLGPKHREKIFWGRLCKENCFSAKKRPVFGILHA